MEFTPVKNAIAVISVENVQITKGGNPPTGVKLTCGSQFTWNYNAPASNVKNVSGQNCAAIMTIGARIKISYDVVESTKFPGTMMKFINEAVPAQPGETDTFPPKEKWTGGGGASTGSSTGSGTGGSSGFSKDGQFRTPIQIQRQEIASTVATLRAGNDGSIDDFLAECDRVLAWADMTPADSFRGTATEGDGGAISQENVTDLASTPAPSAEDSEFPF